MGSATQADEATHISPTPTTDTFPNEAEQAASTVVVIIMALAVTALLLLLLVVVAIGIVILKVRRSKAFSLAHTSEYTLESFDMKGIWHQLLQFGVVVEFSLVFIIVAGVKTYQTY